MKQKSICPWCQQLTLDVEGMEEGSSATLDELAEGHKPWCPYRRQIVQIAIERITSRMEEG